MATDKIYDMALSNGLSTDSCLSVPVLCSVVDGWIYCRGWVVAPKLYCDVDGQGQR